MITGYEYDEYEFGWRQNAWNSKECFDFVTMLHDSGYSFNIHSKEMPCIGDYYELDGKVDNIQIVEPIIDNISNSWLLLKASIYRGVPYVVKPLFEVFSYQYDDVATFEAQCPSHNYDYYNHLVNDRLKISLDMLYLCHSFHSLLRDLLRNLRSLLVSLENLESLRVAMPLMGYCL